MNELRRDRAEADPAGADGAGAHRAGPDRAASDGVGPDRNGVALVRAAGELDQDTVGPLEAELLRAAREHSVVVLDTADLTFADSTFLNLLLRVRRMTRLRLVAPPPRLLRLLELAGVQDVLTISPGLEEAMRLP
ncbi:STAS domain-containing protein [Streptomyces sp. NPDC046876]|uniref:STAS domain-containing protein n=1 Tax=Streptomyces sp. NPDC046876 TaxID=3155616 RepID=UPI0033EF4861